MDDSMIIELFFERSEQAIEELSNKYGTVCRRVAGNILNNPLDSEECVNDAYLGVWNTIPPQRPDPSSVEDEFMAKETAAMIDGWLETLDKQSRIMFVRRYWYADTVEEIAALYGKSRHYVSVKLSRMRKDLKRYLKKEGVFL